MGALDLFHPATAAWFAERLGVPTPAQERAWPAIRDGRNVLVSAPTGSGKTLAAFLAAIDALVRQGLQEGLQDETQVLYVSPLKALSNDIAKNLAEPLEGIAEGLARAGLELPPVRTLVRTGDTTPAERAAMRKRPPHLLVTTPESLYILLTSESGRAMLRKVRTVIVDEIHALLRDKRGSHLALSLERLEALTEGPLVRVGLSATQCPVEEVARFLVGTRRVDSEGRADCLIVDEGHRRALDLALELPGSPLAPVLANEVWEEIHDRLAELALQHRTTLVFVNTRRTAERVARRLADRLGPESVTSHHGSLSKEHRLEAERRLKSGELRVLVATASLELGIDVGEVDLACQLGSTRGIATFLQRVGRSGHGVNRIPKGRLFPLSRDELVECVALLDCIRRGELDRIVRPEQPLDILAQQLVAETSAVDCAEDALFELARGAWPYRNLSREDFEAVLAMLASGFSTARGRRGALVHHDAVNGRVKGRRGARITASTSGGAIPDVADYEVVLEPDGIRVGSLDEDFAIESTIGDIFQLGNASWRVLRVERGKVRVEDARGAPPTLPFWLGEAPARTAELSAALSRLRAEIDHRLGSPGGREPVIDWIDRELGAGRVAAEQVVDYLSEARDDLGVLPTQETLVLERFFDESGGMQLVLHSPFGARINRAWGLALRKRFCRGFNFELQAAADENAIVLSLSSSQGFPLEEVYGFLHPSSARDLLVQALLDAPMFATRFRWNASRSLAIPRFSKGRRMPPQVTRMISEDLLAAVFPDQVACLENIQGDREIPDHPLVKQTIHDCLTEAMDVEGFLALLRDVVAGRKRLIARDLVQPSPLSAEILNAKPYAFLDDAPLEERRTRAVLQRRSAGAEASELGRLDMAAIESVREQARPRAADADELHDGLLVAGALTLPEWRRLDPEGRLLDELRAARRAAVLGGSLVVAAERLPELRAALGPRALEPPLEVPGRRTEPSWSQESALVELVRSRLGILGPTRAASVATGLDLGVEAVEAAMLALEAEGAVLRGRFIPGVEEMQWCDRALLARIHRATLERLRAEIQPVPVTDYMRFLLEWHRLERGRRASGPEGMAAVLAQLSGWEAAAGAWEEEILPARLSRLEPAWLDSLCLSGRIAWGRLRPPRGGAATGPIRTTPIAFAPRGDWRALAAVAPRPEDEATLPTRTEQVLAVLEEEGACFLAEIRSATGLLESEVEEALGELVAAGRVTCDAVAGLRALLRPSSERATPEQRRRRARRAGGPTGPVATAGRWDRLRRPCEAGEEEVELVVRALLRRHGLLFRAALERESVAPPWRVLLRCLRRLEARGEVRGGRFVDRFAGEQYALPEAVGLLRAQRRREPTGELIVVSACDPLNLVGILVPGPRLPAVLGHRLAWRDGRVVATLVAGRVELLEPLPDGERWEVESALRRRPGVPARALGGGLV